MITVSQDVSVVASDLIDGRLRCPGCGGQLHPWGSARPRTIRHDTGPGQTRVTHRPRRGRCTDCRTTHVLLAIGLAARRADSADVIAAAITAKTVGGLGHRLIAARLDRPVSTVRGWLRAFTASAVSITEVFTVLVQRDAPDSADLWPGPASTTSGQAASAVMAYARVLAARFGVVNLAWHSAGLVGAGPWFFSTTRWAAGHQHQLTLMRPSLAPQWWASAP